MLKNVLCRLILLFFISCHSKIPESPVKESSEKIYEHAWHLLLERMDVNNSDSVKRNVLNDLAIQKFTLAYQMDTSNIKAALYASECCMYGRKYQDCIYWLNKLLIRDTSKHDIAEHSQMLGYCYAGLGELNKSYPYFNKATVIWKEILPANLSLIAANLLVISSEIYETNDPNIRSRGIDPCIYSINLLEYLDSIDKRKNYKEMILERRKKCR
jgi:tetratricopeptide (TPR) repeat protein